MLENYKKFNSRKKKYYKKEFSNNNISIKYQSNESFKNIQHFNPKLSQYKTEKRNKSFNKNKINLPQDRNIIQNYIKSYNGSRSFNQIFLSKNNFIKINLNNGKENLKFKNNSKKDFKTNNNSLILAEMHKRINKSKSNSKNKNKKYDKTDNIVTSFYPFDTNSFNRSVSNIKAEKIERKKLQESFDNDVINLEKKINQYNELTRRIKEIQKRIKVTKQNLNSNINSSINYNNYNNKLRDNIVTSFSSKINNIYKKERNAMNNSNNITNINIFKLKAKSNLIEKIKSTKKDKKEISIKNNYNNSINTNPAIELIIKKYCKKENSKDKEDIKIKNSNLYTILNYNSKSNNSRAKRSRKKSYLLSTFISNYNRKKLTLDKALKLPIKKLKNNSINKNSTNHISKNSSMQKSSYLKKSNNNDNKRNHHQKYLSYMTIPPNNPKKFSLNFNIFKTPDTKFPKKIIFSHNKTPILSNSNSYHQLYSLSTSLVPGEKSINKNKKIICLRNKNLSSSSNNNSKTKYSTRNGNFNIFKKIVKNASICRVGKNRQYEAEKINQDNLFKVNYEDLNLYFYGVCDGHGTYGHLVSNFIKSNLPIILYHNLSSIISNIQDNNKNNNDLFYNAIKNSFLQTEYQLNNNSKIDINFSGSTCISLLFCKNQIITANLGDSRAIKGQYNKNNKKWTYEILSKDHKPEDREESLRIKKNNGNIHPYLTEDNEYVGPQRVWTKDKNIPGLAMSRSFGDKIFESVGVISIPNILFFKHKLIDKFIVIASDGLWMYLSNQEVVKIVGKYYEEKNCDQAIEELYNTAKVRWEENDDFIDDISIILFLE